MRLVGSSGSRLVDPEDLEAGGAALSQEMMARAIASEIAATFAVGVQDLLGREHKGVLVYMKARGALYQRLHTELGWGPSRIGRLAGNRGHNTIVLALRASASR